MFDSGFPPFDRTKYTWKPSVDDPSYFKREACGGELIEDVWHRFKYGEQLLFLGARVTLSSPTSLPDVLNLFRKAWISLRFTTPTIASHTEYDEAGNILITYRAAKDEAEVEGWAQRTVTMHENVHDLDELRYQLGKLSLPDSNGDQTFIHLIHITDDSYGILLHTSHVPFDGAGVKILLTLLMKNFAGYILKPDAESYQWGNETKYLLPPITETLSPDEPLDNPVYFETLATVLKELETAAPRMYGFKARNIGPGLTRRIGITFGKEESLRFRQAVREHNFTVSHVAHAAITLVCLSDNPPTSLTAADAAFVFYGLVDTRKHLAAPYNTSTGYPGYSLGMSPIQIPVDVIVSSAAKGEKQQLIDVCSVVRKEYGKQAAYPCLAAIIAQQVELMLAPSKNGGPAPPPWMGPWFAGDGIGEGYLQPVYTDSTGAALVTIDDFFTSLNKTDPGPFFRCYSWRGALTLSVDYNEYAMPSGAVEGFMRKWAELIRLFM